MTENRFRDWIRKAKKTILPVRIAKPTPITTCYELLLILFFTATLTDAHESLCSAAGAKGLDRYIDTI